MKDILYEELNVMEINKVNNYYNKNDVFKKVVFEISLKIVVNGHELASLPCLNQDQEELAVGFLFIEGLINTYHEIHEIYYDDSVWTVFIKLEDGIIIDTKKSTKNINLPNSFQKAVYDNLDEKITYSLDKIMQTMKRFMTQSEIFNSVGGVHSVLFSTSNYELLKEDIGRHNCYDKIAGVLLKEQKIELAKEAILYVSGRISSEIITKVIKLGVLVVVSRSTPTTSAIKFAKEHNITLLGYIRNDKGYLYTCPERIG